MWVCARVQLISMVHLWGVPSASSTNSIPHGLLQRHKKRHELPHGLPYLSKEPSIETWRQVFSLRWWKDWFRTGINLFIFTKILKNGGGGPPNHGNSIKSRKSIKCIGKWTLARLGPLQNALKFMEIPRIFKKTIPKTKKTGKTTSAKLGNPENPPKSNGFPG